MLLPKHDYIILIHGEQFYSLWIARVCLLEPALKHDARGNVPGRSELPLRLISSSAEGLPHQCFVTELNDWHQSFYERWFDNVVSKF